MHEYASYYRDYVSIIKYPTLRQYKLRRANDKNFEEIYYIIYISSTLDTYFNLRGNDQAKKVLKVNFVDRLRAISKTCDIKCNHHFVITFEYIEGSGKMVSHKSILKTVIIKCIKLITKIMK